jgi:hypothetical protein
LVRALVSGEAFAEQADGARAAALLGERPGGNLARVLPTTAFDYTP